MKMIRTGIIGGAGYTGGELTRLLLNHPDCEVQYIHSRSHANRKIYDVHEDLYGETELSFTSEVSTEIDVLFLCSGHGESIKFLSENQIPASVRIIDLSQDHRVNGESEGRTFTYGLCELNKERISNSANIANPGCFATAIQLAILPLAVNDIIRSEIHVNAITGSTGAGQSLSPTTHHSWRNNNHSTYKAFSHQHLDEIAGNLKKLAPGFTSGISFLPHRGSFARGIHAAVYMETDLTERDAVELYSEYYNGHAFTFLTSSTPHVKQVVNTNKCYLQVEKYNSKLMVTSVIDNLLKGASGQAVQNMNIMFGLDERTGLKLKASVY